MLVVGPGDVGLRQGSVLLISLGVKEAEHRSDSGIVAEAQVGADAVALDGFVGPADEFVDQGPAGVGVAEYSGFLAMQEPGCRTGILHYRIAVDFLGAEAFEGVRIRIYALADAQYVHGNIFEIVHASSLQGLPKGRFILEELVYEGYGVEIGLDEGIGDGLFRLVELLVVVPFREIVPVSCQYVEVKPGEVAA